MPATKADKKPRKASRKPKKEYCTYVVAIKNWEMTYLFSLDTGCKFSAGPYMEFLHLKISGLFHKPEKYAGKEMSATFMGDREMFPPAHNGSDPERKPLGVGAITFRGENVQYLGSLPYDSLPAIANLLETKRFQFLHLSGVSPYRSQALISSVHFFKTYNPKEY